MIFNRAASMLKIIRLPALGIINRCSLATTSPSGAILPEPKKPRFAYLSVICTLSAGIFIGANISKNIAHFLEENELFVPSDDDDDD